MRKPDRFEKIWSDPDIPIMMASLLRLQHAAYVKMVRREMRAMGEPREMATFEHGRKAGLTWVLAVMERYRKGTR